MSNGEFEEPNEGRADEAEHEENGAPTSSNTTAAPGGVPGELDEAGEDELSGGTGSGGTDARERPPA